MQPTLSSSSSATFSHPLTRHPPPLPWRRGPHDHPPSTYSVELESPRVRALHTHSRAYVSSCPAAGAATAAATEEEKEKDRERKRDTAPKSESGGSAEKKRQRGYGEGWPKPPLYLSRGTYTRPSGTPTSNVVININGAAQYSPDLASPCVYLRSISLLGQAGPFLPSPSPLRACRTLACGELTLLRFPGPPLTLRKGHLVGMPRTTQVERVYSPLLSERTKH